MFALDLPCRIIIPTLCVWRDHTDNEPLMYSIQLIECRLHSGYRMAPKVRLLMVA